MDGLRSKVAVVLAGLIASGCAAFLIGGAQALLSNTVSVASNSFTTATLQPPTSLSASASGSSIILSWTATVSTYATSSAVMRSTTSGGPYSQIATVSPVITASYTDSSAVAGTRYYYVLQTVFQNWLSANSNQANSAVPALVTNAGTCNSSNAWTNPANAQANPDGVYATAAPAKNATVSGDWGCFGFDSAIPSGVTINKVEILARYRVSTQASIAVLTTQTKVSGALQGSSTNDSSEPLADADFIADVTAARAWTRADLLNAVFLTTIGAQRGSSNTGVTFSLDSVRVRVTYSPP